MAEENIETALEGMVTLQERMVHLIQQLGMPLVEVSMVISKQISGLMKSLNEHIELTNEIFPINATQAWQLTEDDTADSPS